MVTLTNEERDALEYVLDIAHGDQESYLNIGNPDIDYGEEWPSVAIEKAKAFRLVGAFVARTGLTGQAEHWNALADNMEASGKEYEEMHAAEPRTCAFGLCIQEAVDGSDYCLRHAARIDEKTDIDLSVRCECGSPLGTDGKCHWHGCEKSVPL